MLLPDLATTVPEGLLTSCKYSYSILHKAKCEEECRQWSLILGAVILAFGLLPSFRSVRILNIIALVGTNYSCLFFLISAAKKGITHGIITR